MKRRAGIFIAVLVGMTALAGVGAALAVAKSSDWCHDGQGDEVGTGTPVLGHIGVWAGVDYTHDNTYGAQPVTVCYSFVEPGYTDPGLTGGAIKAYVYDRPLRPEGGVTCFADPNLVVSVTCDYRYGTSVQTGPDAVSSWTYVTGTAIPLLEFGAGTETTLDTAPTTRAAVEGPCATLYVNDAPTQVSPVCGADLASAEVANGDLPQISGSGDLTIAGAVTVHNVPHIHAGNDTANDTVTVAVVGVPVSEDLPSGCLNCTLP